MQKRPAFRIRPLITTEHDITPAPLLSVRASSPTGAVAACRAAGFRVMTVGGLVELGTETTGPWGENEIDVWFVTVHP